MLWLCALCVILVICCLLMLGKIILLQRAADEIRTEFAARLADDTNTLITISSGDRHIRALATGVNTQLRLLREARHRYQQGDRELQDAVTNISHDLRTPLTAICGYLDLLAREDKSDAVTRYLAMIGNRATLLSQLTEELFRYSILLSANEEPAYEPVVLSSALEEGISAYYAALKGAGITPEVSLPAKRVQRSLDPAALSRILGNVISNAIKYSDGDLSVTLRENGEIVFSNRASGLTPVTAGQLFDRFFTVETARSATGLGLSIAKLLTERMGGSISAAYADGRLSITLRF